MGEPTWDETTPIHSDNTEPKWEDTTPTEPPSETESALRGAAQGATFGFEDEGVGAVKGTGRTLMDFAKTGPGKSLVENYRAARDEERAKNEAAQTANPKSYLGGNLAGAVATAAIPGAGEANIAKMAALGALQGFGGSNADLTKGDDTGVLKDTALGGGLGAAIGTIAPSVAEGVGKITPYIGNGLGWAAKKGINAFLGPSEEAINARLDNPETIKNALSDTGLAEKLPETLKILSSQISSLDNKAWSTLDDSIESPSAISVDSLKQKLSALANSVEIGAGNDSEFSATVGASHHKAQAVIRSFFNDMKSFLPDPEIVAKQLEEKNNPDILKRLSNQLENVFPSKKIPDYTEYTGTLSEKAQRKIIQAADDNINWDDKDLGVSNRLLQDFRESLDAGLKAGNDEYEKIMEPLAQKIQLLNKVKRLFNLKKDIGEGLVPTETTANKFNLLGGDRKFDSQGAMESLNQATGTDYNDLAQNSRYAKEFNQEGGNRVTVAGAGIGGAAGTLLGGPLGGGIGAMAGGAIGSSIDKNAGQVAGSLIDTYLKNNPTQLGKYAPILQKASAQGARQLGISHFLLMQNDPQYQTIIHGLSSTENQEAQQQ